MVQRSHTLAVLIPLFVLAACGDSNNNVTGTSNTATVRFVNETGSSIDATNGGTVGSGNGNIAFGGNSTCMAVNTSGSSGSGLGFNTAGTSTSIPGFTQNFASGGNYTVVAYPSSSGTTQFATLDNSGFTANSGQSGLRIFNGASGSGNLVALGNGSAFGTGTGVGYGTAGSFMNVNSGSQAVTFNTGTGTSTAANAGTLNFTAGQNYTLFVAPAASGSTALRTFLVAGC